METDNKGENKLEYSNFETVLTRLKLKDKKMYKHITKAGDKFQKAMFKYYDPLVNNEQVPETYNYTKLFGLWKGKGSELDLNIMRYIHGKDWDTKMLEALVAEHMKPKIHAAIPDIQIGGKAGHSSIEHLILIKTWMLNMEVNNGSGIFQVFDMDNFFDKESLIDTLNALYVEGNISDKDYRMWYKLNCKTRISVVTSVGETDAERIFDSIG